VRQHDIEAIAAYEDVRREYAHAERDDIQNGGCEHAGFADDVAAVAGLEEVAGGRRTTVDRVVSRAAVEGVSPASELSEVCTIEDVVACATRNEVIACPARNRVAPGVPSERIVTPVALHEVIAAGAIDVVAPACAVDDVVTARACDAEEQIANILSRPDRPAIEDDFVDAFGAALLEVHLERDLDTIAGVGLALADR